MPIFLVERNFAEQLKLGSKEFHQISMKHFGWVAPMFSKQHHPNQLQRLA